MPLDAADALCTVIPDRFEYRRGVTYVGSTVERPARGRRRRLPGLRAPRADPAAPPWNRCALRVGLPVRRAAATAAPTRSRSNARLARGAAARWGRARRAGVGRHRSRRTACSPASTTSRSATAAPTTTCRRSRASTAARRRPPFRERRDDEARPGDERAGLSAASACGGNVFAARLSSAPQSAPGSGLAALAAAAAAASVQMAVAATTAAPPACRR